MYLAGYISLLLCLLCSLGGAFLGILELWENQSDRLKIIKFLSFPSAAFRVFASAVLLHALYWHDYSVEYVASYTDRFLPVFYRLTAFWAGQPGSMLFWALSTAICGWLWGLTRREKALPPKTRVWFCQEKPGSKAGKTGCIRQEGQRGHV